MENMNGMPNHINGNEKLEKKLDDLIDTIRRKDDALSHCEKKIDELIKINIEKDNIIQKLGSRTWIS